MELRRGNTQRNRKGKDTLGRRRFKKLVGKQAWFQPDGKDEEEPEIDYHLRDGEPRRYRKYENKLVESVFFIPYTDEGSLKKKLNDMERNTHYQRKIKYVESMGPSLSHILVKKTIGGGACNRMDCFLCLIGGKNVGKCMTQGMVYGITCETCKEEKKEVIYVGETARTMYDRGLEWISSIRREDASNPMVAHAREAHPSNPLEFSMDILKMAKTPLIRQITEAQLITEKAGEAQTILNSKGEWGQNLPPRLILEDAHPNHPLRDNTNYNHNNSILSRLSEAEKETGRGGDSGVSQDVCPGDGGLVGAMEGGPPPTPIGEVSLAPPP